MQDIRSQAIKQMAKENYNQGQQSLKLNLQKEFWPHVLLVRDWSMLESLYLYGCGISSKSINALVSLDWPQLTYLDLFGNQLTYEGLQQLTKKEWPKLHSIDLSQNNMKDEGLKIILQKFYQQLTHLQIRKCGLSCRGIYQMVQYSPKNLKLLDMGRNLIGNWGVKHFVKADLPNLESLCLNDCRIASSGIKILTKGKWPYLTKLELRYSPNKNLNTGNLDSWQRLSQGQLKLLKKLQIPESQSLCWVYCVAMETCAIEIEKNLIKISNKSLKNQIMAILESRNLSEEDRQVRR